MSELEISGGNLRITYGSRIVTTTGGTLICLSPTLQTFSKTISYPDGGKDVSYAWQQYRQWVYTLTDDGYKNRFRVIQTAQVAFTRLAEETGTTQNLMTVPTGADFFAAQIRLTRTTTPTHPWFDTTLVPRQKTGSWIPWNGSGLIESSLGLVRLLHLYIDGGQLKLDTQQSIMGPAGSYGTANNVAWGSSNSTQTSREFRVNSTNGLPVWTSTANPYRKTQTYDSGFTDFGPPSLSSNATAGLRINGNNEASRVDPTNYASAYTCEVRGWFGKRSIV